MDSRPNGAAQRAANFATPALRRRMLAAKPTGPIAHTFVEMQRHDGYTTVHAEPGGLGTRPSDTATTAVRAVTVVATAHGRNRWTSCQDPVTYGVSLTRTRTGAPWSVANYEVLG